MRRIEMSGQICGYLKVLREDTITTRAGIHWICRCICGNETTVLGTRLRSGHTKSCGCMHRPARTRFFEKTKIKKTGCVEWTGGTNGVGYGSFYAGKKHSETGKQYAHRWAYEYFIGPIPEDLHLDHLCRNPKCVNPRHLEAVTPRENLLRGEGPSAAHAKKTHCPSGHPYAGDNLYVHPTKGTRHCRACGRTQAQRRRNLIKKGF